MSDSILYKETKTDFCIVGGGLSGLCAALAAARHGVKVVLMQDRPVLGGNSSSEIRMWICGAYEDRAKLLNSRETGIVEELHLENFHCNFPPCFSVWDAVLYGKAINEPNIKLMLNCSCTDVKMDGNRIESVVGWQTTTQTWQRVKADYFADCSGDSILAPLTGAKFRIGRESRDEFDESLEPEKADKKTMGMSCLLQLRETDRPQSFVPPAWAKKFEKRNQFIFERNSLNNFWWIEVGGEDDSIADTEELRDELVKFAYGVWDNIKNNGDSDVENWVLDWVGFLPGKRESRRYVGDYILTQNDTATGGRFDDIVAYGGWPLDDHDPAGIRAKEPYCKNTVRKMLSTYGIPYRSLYSVNIENLFFAGRNISATHAAMSSTRVMATCSLEGQAVGTAVSVAVKYGLSPRGVYESRIKEVQDLLMNDDCYLPGLARKIPELTRTATLVADCDDAENIRNGYDRPIGDNDNGCYFKPDSRISYVFEKPSLVSNARIIFDSSLNRSTYNMPARYYLDDDKCKLPKTIVKEFTLTGVDEKGKQLELFGTSCNYQRFVSIPVGIVLKSITLNVKKTYDDGDIHLFAFDVN